MSVAYLAALTTLALLGASVDPVVVDASLFTVLAHAHVAERRLARELHLVHEHVDAAGMRHDLTRRALHSTTLFL